MRARNASRDTVTALLGSPGFLLVASAIVMLGGVFLLRAWHENRNDLLAAEIRQLKKQARDLRQELIEWRVREARVTSLPAIEAKIAEFHLDLRKPDARQESQILIVKEPDWAAMIQPHVPAGAGASAASPRTAARAAAPSSRTAGLWAGGARPVSQPRSCP
jgi:hypothetical protein